jgi:predicted phage tail protein
VVGFDTDGGAGGGVAAGVGARVGGPLGSAPVAGGVVALAGPQAVTINASTSRAGKRNARVPRPIMTRC